MDLVLWDVLLSPPAPVESDYLHISTVTDSHENSRAAQAAEDEEPRSELKGSGF